MKMDILKKIFEHKLYKETFWAFASKLYSFATFYLLQFFLIRSLTVENWGIWSVFITVINILNLVLNLGIDSSVRIFAARFSQNLMLKPMIRELLTIRILSNLFFVILFVIFFPEIEKTFEHNLLIGCAVYLLPIIFFYTCNEFFKAMFEGLHRLKFNFILNFVDFTFRLVIILAYFNSYHNFSFLALAYTCALGLASFVGFVIYLSKYFTLEKVENKSQFYKEFVKTAFPVFIVCMGVFISFEIDVLLIKYFIGDYETGIYATAKQMIIYLPNFTMILTMGTLPAFAQINDGNRIALKQRFYKIERFNNVIITTLCIFILILSPFLVPLFFGDAYTKSVWVILLYLPYVLFLCHSILTGYLLDYNGLLLIRMKNIIMTFVIHLALNLILIPQIGALGAPIAASVGYFWCAWKNRIEVQKLLNSEAKFL